MKGSSRFFMQSYSLVFYDGEDETFSYLYKETKLDRKNENNNRGVEKVKSFLDLFQ